MPARWPLTFLRARWHLAWATVALLSACTSTPRTCPPSPTPPPTVRYQAVPWSALPGWEADEQQDAWPALLQSCVALAAHSEWSAVCAAARSQPVPTSADVRTFLEQHFDAYSVLEQSGPQRRDSALITAYYEPFLQGARVASAEFTVPLYGKPPDLLTVDLAAVYPELKGKRVRARLQGNTVVPYFSRAELGRDPNLNGDEIVWVRDALDAFVLEVQGSGRVQLATGETIRLQYADENGYPYRSIGRYLVEHGELTLAEADMAGIRRWATAHPERVPELLDANPSVVFFRPEPVADPNQGPKGALGVPLTAGRSVAIDRSLLPLGAPLYLATSQPASTLPLQRLVLAQDTGGAIRGALRADLFWGSGTAAGERAGQMRQPGRLWLLWPKNLALPVK